ncbi:MAG: AAA family ATPase [Acidobacteriota bacterium]|nr:AAA family ATPase [Acidobacteriota bacterium]
MIDRIRIRSFKSIVDQEIELGSVNVFIGANGSGKSNILEALGVLSAAAFGRVDDESLLRRGVRPGVPRLYKSAFTGRKLSPHIDFKAWCNGDSYRVTLNNPLENPKPYWQFKTEDLRHNERTIASRGPKTVKNKEQGLAALKAVELGEQDPGFQLLRLLQQYVIYSPHTRTLRGLQNDSQMRAPLGLSGGNLAEAVKKLNEQARSDEDIEEALEEFLGLIDWVREVTSVGAAGSILSPSVPRPKQVLRFTDRFMRQGKNTLTAYDASEGALYVLFFASLVLSDQAPGCLAVDNFDQALNPRLVKGLVRLVCEQLPPRPDRQMLLTLHNPAALDGLPLADERIRLFTVDRNSEGHTAVRRIWITPELRKLSEEKGWPLSRLWVMGHLGGVPNV